MQGRESSGCYLDDYPGDDGINHTHLEHITAAHFIQETGNAVQDFYPSLLTPGKNSIQELPGSGEISIYKDRMDACDDMITPLGLGAFFATNSPMLYQLVLPAAF